MQKKLFRNIFILLLANLIVKPLWIFGIDLQVQNTLGPADYGFYFVVFNFSFLFHILLDLGMHQFHNREVAQDPSLLRHRFGKLFFLKGIFAILYFLITFLLAKVLGYSLAQKEMLFFLAINQMLLSLILFSRSNFTAMQWYKWDAFFSIFDRILSIILCAFLLYTSHFGHFDIFQFIYAQTIALAFGAILSLGVVVFKGKVMIPQLELNNLLPLVKEAMPYAIVVLLMTIYTRIDVVMLDKLLPSSGDAQAGIYAAGYRILDAINMLPFLLASLMIPFFARQLKSKASFAQELWTAVSLMLVVSVPFVLVVAFFYQEVLNLLYPASDATWSFSFQILLFSFPAVFLSYIFGGFLTAAGRLKSISYFALGTIFINILLNYFWIPEFGASGAALATFISQGLMAFAQLSYVIWSWETDFESKLILKAILYMGLNFISIYVINTSYFHWVLKIVAFIIIAIILSLVLRLVNIKKLNTL
jgi:O-antigen/teichoic acid export membrane protein